MATTTTNFGWDIPQSTDLVKDGATAIAALGQDIDTAFVDFKGGTTGQVLKKTSNTDLDVEWGTPSSGLTLINTTSFSAVSSFNLAASTFTSTYDNYKILMRLTCTSNATLSARMRKAGVDAATTYYSAVFGYDSGGNLRTSVNFNSTVGIVLLTDGSSVDTNSLSIDIIDPFSSSRSKVTGTGNGNVGGNPTSFGTGFLHNTVDSYDAMSFTLSTGNMTGSYSVFGYAK